MDDRDRERRLERRTGRRIVVGGIVGALVGVALGLIVGAFLFRPWSPAHLAMGLAGGILVGGIAMVQGGLAGLEAANPGREPSEHDEPLRRDETWTSPERDERDGGSL